MAEPIEFAMKAGMASSCPRRSGYSYQAAVNLDLESLKYRLNPSLPAKPREHNELYLNLTKQKRRLDKYRNKSLGTCSKPKQSRYHISINGDTHILSDTSGNAIIADEPSRAGSMDRARSVNLNYNMVGTSRKSRTGSLVREGGKARADNKTRAGSGTGGKAVLRTPPGRDQQPVPGFRYRCNGDVRAPVKQIEQVGDVRCVGDAMRPVHAGAMTSNRSTSDVTPSGHICTRTNLNYSSNVRDRYSTAPDTQVTQAYRKYESTKDVARDMDSVAYWASLKRIRSIGRALSVHTASSEQNLDSPCSSSSVNTKAAGASIFDRPGKAGSYIRDIEEYVKSVQATEPALAALRHSLAVTRRRTEIEVEQFVRDGRRDSRRRSSLVGGYKPVTELGREEYAQYVKTRRPSLFV